MATVITAAATPAWIGSRSGRRPARDDAERRLADGQEARPLEQAAEGALPEQHVDEPDDERPRR